MSEQKRFFFANFVLICAETRLNFVGVSEFTNSIRPENLSNTEHLKEMLGFSILRAKII